MSTPEAETKEEDLPKPPDEGKTPEELEAEQKIAQGLPQAPEDEQSDEDRQALELQRTLKNIQTGSLSALSRKRNELADLMSSADNLHLVKKDLDILNERFSAYKKAHENLCVVLDEPVLGQEETRFEQKQVSFLAFRKQVTGFIKDAEDTLQRDLEGSAGGRGKPSVHGSRKTLSQRSATSVKSARLLEKAKLAELEVQQAMLEKQQAMKMEHERLRLEIEMAKSRAREKALADENGDDDQDGMNSYYNRQQDETSRQHVQVQKPEPLQQRESPQQPKETEAAEAPPITRTTGAAMADGVTAPRVTSAGVTDTSSRTEQVKSSLNVGAPDFQPGFVSSTQQLLAAMSLPQPEVPKFGGDVIEYPAFVMAFDARVHSKVISAQDKLYYLCQYLYGDAKEIVAGCLHLYPEQGYMEARRLLQKEYGDPYKMGMVYLKKVQEWPNIKAGDSEGLKKFSMFLCKCQTAQKTIDYLNMLNFPPNMLCIVNKLPLYLQNKWRDQASRARMDRQEILCFADLVSFVVNAAESANDPVYGMTTPVVHKGKTVVDFDQVKRQSKVKSTGSFNVAVSTSDNSYCPLCSNSHALRDCSKFNSKSIDDKVTFIREKRLCFGCLGTNHVSKGCRQRDKCSKCGKRHPTALHNDDFKPQDSQVKDNKDKKDNAEKSSCTATDVPDLQILHAVLPVKIYQQGKDTCVSTYAFYDDGSSGCFMTEGLMDLLGVTGVDTVLQLKTMHGCSQSKSKVVHNLVVTDWNGQNPVQLPRTYTRDEIPVSRSHIPRPEMIDKWSRLEKIASKIPKYLDDLEIGLLIGSNCPKALEPLEVIPSDGSHPYAILLRHGWTLHGPVQGRFDDNIVTSNRIMVQEMHKEIINPCSILQMFEADFNDKIESYPGECGMSQEDRQFLKTVEEGIVLEDGHYTVPLPLRDAVPKLPDNRNYVLKRAALQRKKMLANKKYHDDYCKFMEQILDKGYAEKVTDEMDKAQDGSIWYLPHHGVYGANKPDKIRVVFDCSAKFSDVALNDCLLQGPDLTNSLVGVLTRFRLGSVAFMADIESMFHQVRVPPHQRSLLRFLWWPDGKLHVNPEDYQMTAHLFGAVSSPSVANFALRKAGLMSYNPLVTETIHQNFYVDDCLKSTAHVNDAISLVKDLRDTCTAGGFHLTKFTSNREELLCSIPKEEHSKVQLRQDLNISNLVIERALGVQWDVKADVFGFSVALKEKSPTRRGILSTVASLYDPLGFAAPVTLPAKRILQELCQDTSLGWDDEVPDEYLLRWHNFVSQLPGLQNLTVDRNAIIENATGDRELHVFSDASTLGYGAVVYLRTKSSDGKIKIAHLIGKARLAPTRITTIPRLELMAAVVAVRLASMMKRELGFDVDITYYSDSTTVLHYIGNERKRWPVFVANRVRTIRDFSSPEQWKYVPGDLNPADEASRGLSVPTLLEDAMWLKGPPFLWSGSFSAPDHSLPLPDLEPEIECHTLTPQEESTPDGVNTLMHYFSDWYKLRRAVAVFLKVKQILLAKVKLSKGEQPKSLSYNLEVADIKQSENEILKWLHWKTYPDEMKQLSNARDTWSREKVVSKSSPLYSLNPFVRLGLLCVGGRLRRVNLPVHVKHPVVLPKKSHITEMIIRYEHQRLGHAGRNHVLSNLRLKYWIVAANSAVRNVLFNCVKCRRIRGPCHEQQMSDLPTSRIDDTAPPFTFTGVDYFGPFMVRERRKTIKYYGVVFTCLVSRAVHLEVAQSLDSDSFIHALRRFLARRGNIRELHSDNGSNFVGAEKELRLALAEMNQDCVTIELRKLGIDWKFNPPHASHMGGAWERIIRSVRKILQGLMEEQSLDLESLQTLFCEVEAILNSRPLVYSSDDTQALTPNHILTGKTGVTVPPPGIFERNDLYLKRRWRKVQYLANLFWSRWRREYLLLQQPRQKWVKPKRNIQIGDVVLLRDDCAARCDWPMGRVIDIEKDDTGLVRAVKVKTQNSQFRRPTSKLVLLLATD
jgi:transposase InsO family protein